MPGKGQMDRPGRELRPDCYRPELLNTFCGVRPRDHDEENCHKMSDNRAQVLAKMREVLKRLDQIEPCQQWDTWPTYNNTPGPVRFGIYQPRGKPWDLNRVRSNELIASKLHSNCDCFKKNGLQDNCQRSQCRGRPWCLEEPLPLCPPFTRVPRQYCDPDPYQECPYRPWETSPDYQQPDFCPDDPVLLKIAAVRSGRPSPACCPQPERDCCWKVKCPNSDRSHQLFFPSFPQHHQPPAAPKQDQSPSTVFDCQKC